MNKQLKAREKRILKVKSFFKDNPNKSLILIKANMPSFLINTPINYYLIKIFLNILLNHLQIAEVIHFDSDDGPYFFVILNNQDTEIKKQLINIENTHELGRLIDLDYFIDGNSSISRSKFNYPPRKCFLCDKDAFICIREQNHSKEEISNFIHTSFLNYMKEQFNELTFFSLIRELELEDKMGLVSKTTKGNHKDMDYNLMLQAITTITPYMSDFVEMGYNSDNLNTLLKKARPLGIKVEKEMFLITNNVNCYKGAIFLLSNIALAFGYSLKYQNKFDDIFNNIKIINKDIYDDFNIYSNTFTTKLFKEKNISGIRGVVKEGLEIIRLNLNKITSYSNDKELRNLLYYYILNIDDTNFIKRSKSFESYLTHKNYLKSLNPNNEDGLLLITNYILKHNLSFGGSADLLICSILLTHLKSFYIK